MKKDPILVLSMMITCLLAPFSARAAVVLAVDINGNSGPTETNSFVDPVDASSMAFQGIDPAGSSISQSFTANAAWTQAGTVTLDMAAFNDEENRTLTGTYDELYKDLVIIDSSTTVMMSGLLADTTYDIYLWSFEPNAERDAIWTPTTSGVTNPSAITISGTLSPNPSNSLFSSNATAQFSSATSNALTSSSTGTLTFDLEQGPSSGVGARFNGFAITAIPEPGSAALILSVVVGFFSLVRRKRTRA